MKTFVGIDPIERFLPIDTEKINSILGIKLTNNEYISYLSKLGFEIADTIKIPSHRHDIASQNDLSEEIARIIGYENIKTIPFRLNTVLQQQENKIYEIKEFFVQHGFSEVINFPFIENAEKESIIIDNPLDSSRKNLRISLRESLIENLLYNERRQKDSVKLFEISDIYSRDSNILQEKKLGIIVSGKRGHNHVDFSKNLDANYLDEILNFNNEISIFDIEEISRENLKTKKKEKIFYVEILLDDIPEILFKTSKTRVSKTNFIKYNPISEYPSSSRDFSLSIKNPKQYDAVISYIENFDDQNLKDFFIFDFYKNEGNGEIKVGIRLIFQSLLHTLSETEIKNSTQKLLRPLINLQGVTVPGLDNL